MSSLFRHKKRISRLLALISVCATLALMSRPALSQAEAAVSEIASPQSESLKPPPAHEPEEPHDYLLPGEISTEAGRVRELESADNSFAPNSAGLSGFPVTSTIQYTSFNNVTYTLHAYSGKYVRWALPDSWLGADALSQNDIRQLVDLTDLLYAHMVDVVGGEPDGGGLDTIAVVDIGPYAGLGLVSAKGVEIAPSMIFYIKYSLAVGQLHGVVYHELSHNFDIYNSPYLGYYGDFGHAWTTFLQFYMLTYARAGDYDLDPESALAINTNRWLRAWNSAGDAASWDACIRNGSGCEGLGIRANDAWGGFLLRFARLHGPAAMKRVFTYLKNYRAQHGPVPQTPEDKNDLLVKALAYGANANILCEIDAWRWTASPSARTSIAQQYQAQNNFCIDSDADGYSPVTGDYNNHNQKIHPGAVEVRNGFDDDCNDVIDDVLTAEPVTGDFSNPQNVAYPGRITGRIPNTNDTDTFNFNLTSPRKVAFKLCSSPDFQGWLFLRKPDGNSHGFQFTYRGECTIQTYDLDAAGAWSFDVTYNGSSLPGAYSVQFYDYKQWPAPWGTTAPPTLQQGSYRLTATAQTIARAFKPPTEVRFWVDGFGFVGAVPYAATVSFDWTLPAVIAPGTYGYRAQLFSGSIPVEAPTAAQLFDVGSTPPPAPTLASLTLSPTTVAGGNAATGKVTLSAPAPPSGTVIALTDTNPAATVPSSVTIPAGATSKTFTVSTAVVTAIQSGTVTAKLGALSKSVALKVRPIGVKSLTLTPNPVVGPNAVTGTVVLEHAAAPGNITVTLTSTNPSVANPTVGTITIPAGVTSKTFTVRTTDVATSSTATIKATANAVSKSRTLTVN